MDITIEAERLARSAHSGQVDKAGRPYAEHPAAVAAMLIGQGCDDEVVAIGWLHDVVEDTEVTLDHLRQRFGDRVADAVDCLTHRKGERNDDYHARVRTNPDAVLVKLADIAHNSDPDRLAVLDEPTRLRLVAKYHRARRAISG